MYILKNSLISILRNKGRNILIGIIILAISCSTTVTLAIRNTANELVNNYIEANDIIATISFDRQALTSNFKGGEDAQKSNIEAFNNIESFTLEDVKNYGQSEYLKDYYYIYATSLNSDTLTKASDSFEYEVEDKQTTTSSSTTYSGSSSSGREMGPGMGEGGHTITNNNTTTFDGYECVISSELASLNEITVGSTITLKNPNTEVNYEFTVTGIYEDNSETNSPNKMYSESANKIITGSAIIEKLVEEDSTLVTNITPSFIVEDEESIEKFTAEIKEKGLNEYYTISTNLEELQSATKSIENVKTFATTFLIIILIIASIVLFVINMINIRERKYEIGVFRTIGVSKLKLTMQFILELLIVTIIMLCIGAVFGTFLSKPVGNMLLQNEIESTQVEDEEISNNFGRDQMMDMNFKGTVNVQAIDEINAVVDSTVIAQLLGIGILLTLISSLASMISIQRFSPLTILKERS